VCAGERGETHLLPLDSPALLHVLFPRGAQRSNGVEGAARWCLLCLVLVLVLVLVLILILLLILIFIFTVLLLVLLLLILIILILILLILLLLLLIIVENLHTARRRAPILVSQERLRRLRVRSRAEAGRPGWSQHRTPTHTSISPLLHLPHIDIVLPPVVTIPRRPVVAVERRVCRLGVDRWQSDTGKGGQV
jgi:hypothetical protein